LYASDIIIVIPIAEARAKNRWRHCYGYVVVTVSDQFAGSAYIQDASGCNVRTKPFIALIIQTKYHYRTEYKCTGQIQVESGSLIYQQGISTIRPTTATAETSKPSSKLDCCKTVLSEQV
jgi:hypothetical protein